MHVLIPAADLQRRVAELAAQIDTDYRWVGRDQPAAPGPDAPGVAGEDVPRPPEDPLIAVGVLKGSVFFLADLLKRLTVPVAVDFFQTSSYGAAGTSRGEVRIRKDLDLSIRGRDVLLVEDIVDSGYTVRTILDLLRFRGARSVRLCTLLDKAAARQVEVPIDYRGFAIDNLFVVGYGLDHGERYRNLPHIAVWEPAADSGILSDRAALAALADRANRADRAAGAAVHPTRAALETSGEATASGPATDPERSDPGMELHHTEHAPAAVGPYSQAVSAGGFLYTAGQVGLDPATGKLVEGGFEAQARRVLENLRQVLATAGCGFADVIKATVFVTDLADFPRLNALYAEAMGGHRPARSTVQVSALPLGALVEIDLVARLPGASG